MGKKLYSITVTKLIPATPSQVWETWKKPDIYNIIHQIHKADIDFKVGGANQVFFFPDKEGGETFVYQEIMPERKLVFAWQDYESFQVTVALDQQEGGTLVSVTQDYQDDPEWIYKCLDGWAWILDLMDHFFETGQGYGNDEWRELFGGYKIVKTSQ